MLLERTAVESMADAELSAAIAPLSAESERRKRERSRHEKAGLSKRNKKGTEMPGMQSPADARREKARRGWFPQRNREGALPFRRLGQVRRRRRGMREEDETDEQLLPVPQALLRIAQGHQVLQAGSIRELLPLPLEPRQEARAEGHDRFPLQQGLRDAEKRNVQNVGFACVNERRLFSRNFKRNDNVVFDSVGMYAIIYFCKFSLNRPPDLLLFVGF